MTLVTLCIAKIEKLYNVVVISALSLFWNTLTEEEEKKYTIFEKKKTIIVDFFGEGVFDE